MEILIYASVGYKKHAQSGLLITEGDDNIACFVWPEAIMLIW